MNYIKKFAFILILPFTFSLFGQQIDWINFEEAIDLNDTEKKVEKKKVIIDMYTDWCGWCKKMDATTFSDPSITKYVNENFHAVKFDGEQKEDIVFKGQTFKFVPSGRRGYHQLAGALVAGGRLSYPNIIFLDEDMNVIQAIPGYQDAKTLSMIMTYFAEDHYIDTPWKSYVSEVQANQTNTHPAGFKQN
jgi:thioredoxin-related protein